MVEIDYKIFPDLNIEGGIDAGTMRGNAVSVDLGQDGLVFVIDRLPGERSSRGGRIVSASLSELPLIIYGLPGQAKPSVLKKAVLEAQQEPHGPADVPAEMMPMLVHFKNIDDPRTIEGLYAPDLEEILGPDVRFVSATLEMTDEPLSAVPASWPDWLKQGNPDAVVVPSFASATMTPSRIRLAGLRIRNFIGGSL